MKEIHLITNQKTIHRARLAVVTATQDADHFDMLDRTHHSFMNLDLPHSHAMYNGIKMFVVNEK